MNQEQLAQFNQLLDDAYSEIGSANCVQSVAEENSAIAMGLADAILMLAKKLNTVLYMPGWDGKCDSCGKVIEEHTKLLHCADVEAA